MIKRELLLPQTTVTIFGSGLMGGSLALALKSICKEVNAVESDPEVVNLAERMKLFSHVSDSPGDFINKTDLIVLATPVSVIKRIIGFLPEWVKHPVMVMDLGSSKVEICRAYEDLPNNFQVVGGHPMCGKETLGLEFADAALFQRAKFALVSLASTTQNTRIFIERLVRVIGALPIWIDAEQHDQWVAATSHLPYLVAAILAISTPPEASDLIGPGLKSSIRLAATPTSMMLDVILSNRNNIADALHHFGEEFSTVTNFIEKGSEEEIKDFLNNATKKYNNLIG